MAIGGNTGVLRGRKASSYEACSGESAICEEQEKIVCRLLCVFGFQKYTARTSKRLHMWSIVVEVAEESSILLSCSHHTINSTTSRIGKFLPVCAILKDGEKVAG